MITFYKADETDFDNNGLGVLDHDIQNPDIEEKLNDIFTFSFNYPIFGVNGARLAARMIVKADDPENEGQLFRIMKLSKSNGMLTAFCYHIFYDLNGNEIPDTNIVGQNGQTAITQMLSKTAVAHKFQGFSDIAETANIRVVRMSPVKFLLDTQTDNNFINRLGGEIRRVNYRIWMNKIRGSDNGATIRWKKSLDSYNATWDYTTVATRIRPVGYNGIMLPESYVDSPLINKYETIAIKEIQYSDIKAIDPDATSNDETAVPLEQAYELMRQAAAEEFSENNLDKPTVTLTVNMVALRNMNEYKDVKSLETINPWDTVTVINERDGLSVKVRLNHYHWNPVTHKFISMELGNSKSTFTDIGSKVDHATNLANQANDTANTAAESANGKNSNYYGPSEPSRPVDGDLWYKKNGDKTELWQYDGKSVPPGWKLVVDDATGEEVRQNVDAAQKEAEEAKKQANKAVDGANDAVAKVGFANDTATQAKSDAATAGQQAKDALTNAGTALTNAKTALDNVAKLDQTVKTEVTNINGQLAQKVSQTTFDTLKGTVTSQGTLINQNKDAIKLKADQTYVDTIKGTVANNTAAIDLNSKEIKLKASQSDVDKLGGRVTDAEAQIKLQADQIALTVSKTELTNILGDYATQTWTQSQIKSTADRINLSVSKVQSNLDNMQIGSRNYLKSSDTVVQLHGVTQTYPNGVGANQWYVMFQPIQRYTEDVWVFSTNYIPIAPTPAQPNLAVGVMNHNTKLFTVLGDFPVIDGRLVAAIDLSKVDKQFDSIIVYSSYNGWENSKDKNAQFDHYQMERATTVSDWHPAPEDMATEVQFSQLQLTVNGIQGTVQNKADQSQVTQLAGQITSVVSTANGNSSQITQLSKDINLRVTADQVDASILADKTIKDTRDDNQPPSWYYANYPKQTIKELKRTSTIGIADGSYAQLTSEIAWTDKSVPIKQTARTNTQTSQRFSTSETTWSSWSTIADTSNVISQINISPESILIAGQKVHITGQTSIDNAVIKDAMIANVTADKITAGTLNAANVNVINLNANNITTGTLKGTNLSLNLNTGEVLFQKGAIRSTNGNLNIDIASGRMAVMDKNGDGFFFEDGMLLLSNSWDTGNAIKYGSITYGAAFPGSGAGIIIKGVRGATLETEGHSHFAGVITESGINVYPNSISMTSVGKVNIIGGSEYSIGSVKDRASISIGSSVSSDLGDRIVMNADYIHLLATYRQTASGSANVIVTADGALVRSTSASKYKTDIVRTNISNYGEKLLELPTATWVDIAETKRYRDDPTTQPEPTRNFGMIAEDLADAGLEMLVVRGTDGELEGINYDRIGPALIPVIAKLKNKIEKLEQKLEEPV